jgi:hypothetical protein
MWVIWKLVLVRLEIVLTLMQDMCTVCAERPEAQKSFWTHPMELLGVGGRVESRLSPFGDRFRVNAR